MPKLTHPNSKQTIDVAPDAVPMYASQGWVPAKSSATTKKATAPSKSGK